METLNQETEKALGFDQKPLNIIEKAEKEGISIEEALYVDRLEMAITTIEMIQETIDTAEDLPQAQRMIATDLLVCKIGLWVNKHKGKDVDRAVFKQLINEAFF